MKQASLLASAIAVGAILFFTSGCECKPRGGNPGTATQTTQENHGDDGVGASGEGNQDAATQTPTSAEFETHPEPLVGPSGGDIK